MICPNCGDQYKDGGRFCRKCGSYVASVLKPTALQSRKEDKPTRKLRDPDELVSNGIGSVIMGDGFFFVAVILSTSNAAVSSALWLLLLLPAFLFFGKGFADVLHARQIRRRLKKESSESALAPPPASIAELIANSGKLVPISERTRSTHDLESRS